MKRWVLLEHRLSKENLKDIHFDLLLEDTNTCKTWRLEKLPRLDGPSVSAIPIAPHKLYWLERNESDVSGGRGWAQRVEGGFYSGDLSQMANSKVFIKICFKSKDALLEIKNQACRIVSL